MSKVMGYRILSTLVCTLVFVTIAAAHEVSITSRAFVGEDTQLQPGTYRVEVEKHQDSAEVRFFQGGDLVATARATLTKEAEKCKHTEVHYDEVDGGQVITKIRLQGSNEGLVFNYSNRTPQWLSDGVGTKGIKSCKNEGTCGASSFLEATVNV